MTSPRRKFNNNRIDRVNFDKKFDQLFEAGRQIADGFSGTRPGTRKRSNLRDFSRRNIRNVGNWVTDKMDSLFEDDFEEWNNDNFDGEEKEFKSLRRSEEAEEDFTYKGKRPLEAISLRSKDVIIEKQRKLPPSKDYFNEEWEKDSFFQTNKWKRSSHTKEDSRSDQKSENKRISIGRNLPRSRRRRL